MISIIIFGFFAICFGAIHCESVQYWISKVITPTRRNSPLVGDWQITYEREGESVTEAVRIYAAFADVAYGDLHAQLLGGGTALYRVRIEHQFDDIYSAVVKPSTRSQIDIGMGVIELDVNSKTAKGKFINATRQRLNAGEEAQMREVVITKANS
ncbi:hypothetical protein N9383_04860 [Granulosicoccus sp.]|nr:hypothetical protein [Granulosicoccus sp.]